MSVATESTFRIPAQEGLLKLIDGNRRFMRGEARFRTVCKEILAEMAKGQQPFATILGCSDSRVPPELIFDASFGELFIIRVAGNVISREVMGSLQYAGAHLRTPLFVVLGHDGCGAVKAALQFANDRTTHQSHIQGLVDNIVAGFPERSNLGSRLELSEAIEANVCWSMRQIAATPEWAKALKLGAKLIGAIYKISSGEVQFLGH